MTIASELSGGFSASRVFALVRRYIYLLRASWPRLLELVYWPAVQMVTWGFLQTYVMQTSNTVAFGAGVFIGGMLLWDLLFRSQLGFSMSFLEEMWARNMGNLLMSPLRPLEFVAALMVMSLVRLALGLGPVALLAIPFFGFNVFSIGLPLAVFIAHLVLFGWAVALVVSGLVLRNGLGAEGLAWTVMFIVLPLGCVYYPVGLLPAWLQPISWALPPTAVFEGLRAILTTGAVRPDLMLWAFGLNIVYIAVSIVIFLILLERSRDAGSLVQMGE